MSKATAENMQVSLLTEIYRSISASNTNETYPISASGAGSRLKIDLDAPLMLNKNSSYKLEILRWSMVGNVKNINASCNKFALTKTGADASFLITPGMYEYGDLVDVVKTLEPAIGLTINYNIGRSILTLPAGYVCRTDGVDDNSVLKKRFGFTSAVYSGPGTFTSEETPSISDVDEVQLCSDLTELRTITKSRDSVKASRSNVLWSIAAGDLTPNRTNTFEKATDLFYPLTSGLSIVNHFSFWLADQNGTEIPDPCELSVFARICQIRSGEI